MDRDVRVLRVLYSVDDTARVDVRVRAFATKIRVLCHDYVISYVMVTFSPYSLYVQNHDITYHVIMT